jgi:hypothetical protein
LIGANGTAHRQFALVEQALASPEGASRLADYERWYGAGRSVAPEEWDKFISGEVPRYRDHATPEASLQRDLILRLYRALPDGPQKAHYRAAALHIQRLAIPRWRAVLDPTNADRY